MASNNLGKKFENNFAQSSKKDGFFTHRLKDTDLSFNGNPVSSYTPSNKCDFYIFGNIKDGRGTLFGIECKSTGYSSIGIQRTKEDPEKMIKYKQIESLVELAMYDGIEAGFVLNFRDDDCNLDDTYYMSIKDFLIFLNETQKKSINKTDCELRALRIDSKLKRVNYIYDIKKMINDIMQRKEIEDGKTNI